MKFCNDPEIICSQINRGFAFLDKNIIPPLERAAKFTHSVVTTDTAKIGALAVGGIALAVAGIYTLKKAFKRAPGPGEGLASINRELALAPLQDPVARAGARAALACGVIASFLLGNGALALKNSTSTVEAGPVLGLTAIFLGSAYLCAQLAVKEQAKQNGEESAPLSFGQLIRVIGKEAGAKGAALLATGALAGYLGAAPVVSLAVVVALFTRAQLSETTGMNQNKASQSAHLIDESASLQPAPLLEEPEGEARQAQGNNNNDAEGVGIASEG